MDSGAVALFPTIKYNHGIFASIEDATCTICLIGYEERENLRILPQCGHAFHVKCIDAWLRQQSTCPICRVCMQRSPLRRNNPSLLSVAVRARFTPGAIPESLFEKPLFALNSPGGQTPDKCKTCSSGCEPHATKLPSLYHAYVDLKRSVHLNNSGKGAESTSDDDPRDTRISISGSVRELQLQALTLDSGIWVRGEVETKASLGGMSSKGVEDTTVVTSAIVENRGERVFISVDELENIPMVASRVGMVGMGTGGIDEGEASECLKKQKIANRD